MPVSLKQLATLLAFLLLTAAAASSGAAFPPGAWYETLAKPVWTPPDVVFPLAWTVLYIMIALAGWLAWRAEGFGRLTLIWLAQLVLNAFWSYAMFGLHQIGLALAVVAGMWLTIGAFVMSAWSPARNAARLFLPYWAWVSFAAALNLAVWVMNR